MNAICIKPTKKLVKDALYKVAQINNQNLKGYQHFVPTIRIYLKDSTIQTFPLSSFKPDTGTTFPQTVWTCPDYQQQINEREQMKIDSTLKAGDYLVPNHDGLKTLVKGKKYKVKDVNVVAVSSYWTNIKIKLEGSERWYASWNFRKCTNQEVRDIGLKTLFDEKVDTEVVGRLKRKIDYLDQDEKNKKLLDLIIISSNDRYRNQMDIIDWTIEKTGGKFNLNRSDFDSILNLKLSEILSIIK